MATTIMTSTSVKPDLWLVLIFIFVFLSRRGVNDCEGRWYEFDAFTYCPSRTARTLGQQQPCQPLGSAVILLSLSYPVPGKPAA